MFIISRLCLHFSVPFYVSEVMIIMLDQSWRREKRTSTYGAAAKLVMRILTCLHLFDTYTRSKVNAAPPLNPNPTPRDDRTRNPRNT
jgi:hypothetical protein